MRASQDESRPDGCLGVKLEVSTLCFAQMPSYKLYYFNVRGRGELARLVLNYAGVPFEDYRFEMADWPAIKPSK